MPNNSVLCTRCYRCKSTDYRNIDCDDPVTSYKWLESRECPEGEQCAKITGKHRSSGQNILVRDCYKMVVDDYGYGYYRHMDIPYYTYRIDGWVYNCQADLCNGAIKDHRNPFLIAAVIILIQLLLRN